VIYYLKFTFVFTKWFLPEDDPVGSKTHGRNNETNKQRANNSVYVDVCLLAVSSRSAGSEMKMFKEINSVDFLYKYITIIRYRW